MFMYNLDRIILYLLFRHMGFVIYFRCSNIMISNVNLLYWYFPKQVSDKSNSKTVSANNFPTKKFEK
jgi:hypothetical protein